MTMRQSAIALLLVAGTACPPYRPGPVPPAVGDSCERAGARLEQLECKRADGSPAWVTPAGARFADVCREAFADGRDWRADCLAVVPDCSRIDEAYRTPRGRPCP